MGIHNIIANNADIPISGDSSFVWQCITFLLKTDLIVFTAIGLGIVIIGIIAKMFIEILED